MQRALALRRELAARADMRTLYSSYARILFGARYMREHPQRVTAWTDALTALPPERQVSVKRIDMTLAHDTRARLAGVQQPSFVVCGSADSCARLPHSRELARLLPDAQFAVLPGGGHFLHIEQDEPFFETVRAFIDRN
jgi:aminoacrylate hydrolase